MDALIAEHSNCTMLNVSGQTPLDVACQNGHAQVNKVFCLFVLAGGELSLAPVCRSSCAASRECQPVNIESGMCVCVCVCVRGWAVREMLTLTTGSVQDNHLHLCSRIIFTFAVFSVKKIGMVI